MVSFLFLTPHRLLTKAKEVNLHNTPSTDLYNNINCPLCGINVKGKRMKKKTHPRTMAGVSARSQMENGVGQVSTRENLAEEAKEEREAEEVNVNTSRDRLSLPSE